MSKTLAMIDKVTIEVGRSRRALVVSRGVGQGGRESTVAAAAKHAAKTHYPLGILEAAAFEGYLLKLTQDNKLVTFATPEKLVRQPDIFSKARTLIVNGDVLCSGVKTKRRILGLELIRAAVERDVRVYVYCHFHVVSRGSMLTEITTALQPESIVYLTVP